MKRIICLTIMATALVSMSCSTLPLCSTSSVIPMEGKTVTENLGKTKGSSMAVSVLGLFMVGYPDMQKAIDEAISLKGGDTLINVRCYEDYRYYFLFATTEFIIYGDAVKISDRVAEEKNRGGKK